MDAILAQFPAEISTKTIRSQLLDPNINSCDCDDTAIVQPALFAYEMTLGRVLLDLGMVPSAILGHSLGELSAACLAGVFELPVALRLVCLRGSIMAQTEKGGMVLMHTDVEGITGVLNNYPELDLAVVNSPECSVVGGPSTPLNALMEEAAQRGWQPRKLRTSHAFHTRLMEPALVHYRKALEGVALYPPRWPMLSGQDGQWLSDDLAPNPEHWVQQLRNPVRFDLALARSVSLSDTLLEVGPTSGLLSFARDAGYRQQNFLALGGDRHQTGPERHILFMSSLGKWWQTGGAINWDSFNRHWLPRRKLSLPLYPFERERHWLPSSLPRLLAMQRGEELTPTTSMNAEHGNTSIPGNMQPEQVEIKFQPRPALETAYSQPRPGLEQEVANIWQSLLFIANIGRHDDFFTLGGNSILALRLCQQVRKLGWALTPQEVFQARNIASLCSQMEAVSPAVERDVHIGLDPKDAEALAEIIGKTELS